MEVIKKAVSDLGAAAYMMMNGFKVVGKQGRSIMFEVIVEASKEFDDKHLEYLSSEFHRFDSCIMSLKKIGEYNPNSN